MKIQVCARCKKRPAMVFITRIDNGNSINEGLCLNCASELGIKPVNDMLKSMGISDEEISGMADSIEGMMEGVSDNLPDDVSAQNLSDGKLPTMNLGEILGFSQRKKGDEPHRGRPEAKENPRKTLNLYCTNLNKKASEGKVDRIIGRDREIDRIIQILCRRQKITHA